MYIKKHYLYSLIKKTIMKRTIIIVRHAKSDWSNGELSDFERPLNARGKRDIPIMASYLIQHYPSIDLAIASDSVRTTETIEGIKKYGYTIAQLSYNHKLYLASKETIETIISETPETTTTILICAHNPGVSDFVQSMCGLDFFDMPTLGIVYIEVEIEQWTDIFSARGSIVRFDYPKKK